MNPYRAVVDMAEAMTEALGPNMGPNMGPYSGEELEKALNSGKGVMYYSDVDELTVLGKMGLSINRGRPMEKLSWDIVYGEERE